MARYDETNAERDQGLEKLRTSYLGALKRHLAEVQKTGRLERVIPVRDEVEAIEGKVDPLPELPEKAGRELKDFREKYVAARERILQTHAQTLVELADKMDEALKSAEASLTKAGKIDEALAAKRMRETLAEDAGIQGARSRPAKTSQSRGDREWRPLLDAEWEILERGSYWVGDAKGATGKGSYDGNVKTVVSQLREEGAPHFLAVPPARVEFRFDREITELKAKVWIFKTGEASFKVSSGEGRAQDDQGER